MARGITLASLVAFVRGGNNVDNFKEMTIQRADSQGKWKKIYYQKFVGWATPTRFELIGQSIGKLLDESQLSAVNDWSYIRIELVQHNDRIIDATVKCADHG